MKHSFFTLSLLVLSLSLATAKAAVAAGHEIYGWDISCRGADGLKVAASQSDDDFYIQYEGKKVGRGRVWADTTSEFDSSLKNIVFMTNQGVSKGPEAALSIVRGRNAGFGFAPGVLILERERFELNCFVRYGTDEDDFDTVSRKPFPVIRAP